MPTTSLTESAAPPRASPSILVSTTPSSPTASSNVGRDVHGLLTGHRVDDEQRVRRVRRRRGPAAARPSARCRSATGRRCRRSRHCDRAAPLHRARTGRLRPRPAGRRRAPTRPARRPAVRARAAARPPPDVAGRRPTSRTCRPWPLSWRASLPAAVVFPAPWRPHIITTVGGFGLIVNLPDVAAERRDEFLVDDLDDLLRRAEALLDLGTIGAFLQPGDQRLDHLDVDVGFEQSEADLTGDRVDVGLGQLPAAAQAAKRCRRIVRRGRRT